MSTLRLLAAALGLSALTVFLGCTEPLTMYQVPDSSGYHAGGGSILVMPFMDTRTFVPASDPHTADLGNHARDIFVAALREYDPDADVRTPAMSQPARSMTNAEVAEIGRRHGADVVVAGQVFSFTDTRAASIPPRAGMFVRVISAADGSLLFTGDHYQAASYPMAGGGRDLQARNVSSRLVEGFLSAAKPAEDAVAAVLAVASHTALANLSESVSEPPPFPNLDGRGLLDPAAWDEQLAPEVPPLADLAGDDFYQLPAPALPDSGDEAIAATETDDEPEVATGEEDMPTPLPPPSLEELGLSAEPEVAAGPDVAVENETEPVEAGGTDVEVEVAVDTAPAATIDELPEIDLGSVDPNMIPADAVYPPPLEAAKLSGDELAADLFEADGDLWEGDAAAGGALPSLNPAEFAAPLAPAPVVTPAGTADGPVSETAGAVASHADAGGNRRVLPVVVAAGPAADNGPVISMPLAVEQPRTVKSVDMEPAAVPTPAADGGPVRVLVLPYHDRDNPNNLIANTGGGEVVTTLYGTQLTLDPGVQIMWDGTGQATHHRLLSREDALEMGRLAGADYVIRGQVVEFRRAQSVPSFFSAVISTAMLAAQIFFAEMSGVDVATEVYRVADGRCVMSRRDRAQQKYVVQAEKTVRRMAIGMAESISQVVREADPQTMDPLIDDLEPATLFSSPS